MLPFWYNVVLFAILSGVGGVLGVVWGVDSFGQWVLPVTFLVVWNLASIYQERTGTAVAMQATEKAVLQSGLAWGFVTVLLALPVMTTYQELSGTSTEYGLALVIAPGILVALGVWVRHELRQRTGVEATQ